MLGDTPWDVEAAPQGRSRDRLPRHRRVLGAGAPRGGRRGVFESLGEVRECLEELF